MSEPKILTEAELQTALDASPSPFRLTPQIIEAEIKGEEYLTRGSSVIAILTLRNGFVVTGVGGAIDPANFDEAVGRTVSRRNAVNEIWRLEGHLARSTLLEAEAARAEVEADPAL